MHFKPYILEKVTCVDLSSEGKGVVKDKDKTIFVDGLFVDELADIEVVYSRAGVFFGKVKKLHKLSKDRIQPKCKICTSCGGCQFQQLNYQSQLEYKTKRVITALTKIGKLDNPKVLPCIGMDDPYFYRNKIQVPFGKDKKGNIIFGFYKENSHEIIPIKECCIENKVASSILWDIKELLKKYKIPVYEEDTGKGILRHVLIRTSFHFNDLMVVLVVTKLNFPGQRDFINELVKLHPEITTIVENENHRHTNVILGEREKTVYGKGYIKDSILGLTFKISASSFFQINPIQVEKLYSTALESINLNNVKTLLDAYSGVGTIGLLASKCVKNVISVEINKFAHLNAIDNAKQNNINNIKFYCGDAGEFIKTHSSEIDAVIMDPPRAGSSKEFLQTLIDEKINTVVYVSCNPETLARDIKYLSPHYEVNVIQPVDMFPMTSHVETVVLMSKIAHPSAKSL